MSNEPQNLDDKHLTYFKVENFKRFQSLEIKDIGHFNLVLGNNNVGKTSLLEALLFTTNAVTLQRYLLSVLFKFRNIDSKNYDCYRFFLNDKKNRLVQFVINQKEFAINFKLGREITIFSGININNYDNFISSANYDDFNIEINYRIPYIPFYLGYKDDLIVFFSENIQQYRSVKKNFIEALRSMIPAIENIEIELTNNKILSLGIVQTDREESLPLPVFGEGTIKLFRILAEIIVHKGERLMIDEIDAGIHYKRFKSFWEIILKVAKDNDVQLFATTHSIECLQAFKEVLEEQESLQADARCIEMQELPNGSIKTYTYDFEKFKIMLETGTNIRGGKYE